MHCEKVNKIGSITTDLLCRLLRLTLELCQWLKMKIYSISNWREGVQTIPSYILEQNSPVSNLCRMFNFCYNVHTDTCIYVCIYIHKKKERGEGSISHYGYYFELKYTFLEGNIFWVVKSIGVNCQLRLF